MFSSLFQDDGTAESTQGEISPLGVAAFPPMLYSGASSDALFDWQNTICAEAANRASLENGQTPIHDYHITSPEAAFLTCLSEEFNGYFAAQAADAHYSQSVNGQSQNAQLQQTQQLQMAQNQQMNHVLQNSDGQHATRLLEPLDAQLMISMADVLPLGQTFEEEMKTPPLMLSDDMTLSLTDKRPKDKKLSRDRSPKKTAAATPVSKNIAYMNLLHLASAADVGLPEFLSAAPGVEMSLENAGAPAATSDTLTAAGPLHDEIIAPDFTSFRSGLIYTEQTPTDKDLRTPETPSEFAFLHDTDSQDLDFQEDSLKLEPIAFVPRISGPQQLHQQHQQPHALLPQHHLHSYHIPQSQHSNMTRPSPSSSVIRNKREKPATHTPRPPNSFIIYRKEKHAELMSKSTGTSTLNNNVISKIVGTMWKQEPPEIKAMYAAKAQEEKRIHMLKHPDYKYRPKKSPPKQSTAAARASSVSVGEQTNPLQRFVKMQPLNHPHPYPPSLSSNNMQSHQNSFVGGSIAALPPAVPGSGSHGVGGMGMSVSALEDLQYCQMGADFFPMHQAMYAGGYPGFDQSVWADGGDAGNGFMYWAQTQMQQPQPPSKGFSFDAQGS
ncbi:hypothetical protein HDU81_010310 [Chytriomyces hyalinus]|nr:hypothetical protein HDU81_010310 [Chytriomyces hyalinus]